MKIKRMSKEILIKTRIEMGIPESDARNETTIVDPIIERMNLVRFLQFYYGAKRENQFTRELNQILEARD